MKHRVILDTGPLVAFINGRDRYHQWSAMQWAWIHPPLLTCEAVLSEACFLLGSIPEGQPAVLELIRRGVLHLPFRIEDHVKQVGWLLQKYADLPISLADACLVRMSELYDDSSVLTIDDHFRIFRKNRRQVIPTFSPQDL